MKNYFLITLIALAGVLVACNTDTPAATRTANPSTSASAPVATAKGDVNKGKAKFNASCISCHGAEGKGITSLAPSLQTSAFLKSQTDEQLIAFIKKGRDKNDPVNTTKIAMPPKGGDPSLTDSDLTDIVAYMRTLQK